MNERLEQLIKASDAIGQAIERLERLGEMDQAAELRKIEAAVLDLQDSEPCLAIEGD
jgi:hypothetical protein